ncbi:MAG TPA: hypothetical protein VHK69_03985 [Chitinophagaceae bacterium]|jgi:hypothetical protein|nr:hypothetical protein [Chitinophagaceae bacterium]
MKRVFTLFLLFCISNGLSAQRNLQQLLGAWASVDAQNGQAGLEIRDSARVYLVYGGQKKAITQCRFDFTKSPAWFDFTIRDGNESMTIKSLLHFVNDDLIQWQLFEDASQQPVHFASGKGEMIYLKRKRE